MTAAQLVAEAARIDANPYFLAYTLATGATSTKEAWDRDGNGGRFMAWNGRRWRETMQRLGLPAETPHKTRFHAAHLDTLAAAIPSPAVAKAVQMELFADA
ncbi:hypothetical protein [Pseudoroseomonas cervicalis]|uniref:hypothetical protein n=1 Tax=Teichococcus cervicalis TaxID=204525 RepID=UPI0027807910|nr:hypothetical protein [Pseudoroseomonas cervicalis]MDQ1077961.1 hypothetical protein [Pseudoroseomonas cervicalis]